MMITPVVLAGGFGTRLWPISRKQNPKQFARLTGEKTLFEQTLSRLPNLSPPIVVCSVDHYDLVVEQLRLNNINNAQIILEPIGKGTAPAIAIAAFKMLAKGLDPLLFILPADHVISNLPKFHTSIEIAKKYAEQDFIVCFGVVPNHPETGYGYIEFGNHLVDKDAYKISRFVEKPNIELAKKYFSSGKYYWNSGMFMLRASIYLKELKQNAYDIYRICEDIVINNSNSSNDLFELDVEKFSTCPSDTIDYVIMEKTKNAIAVPIDIGWNDLGSWRSLWECGEKDSDGNVIIGNVDTKDVSNSYIHTTKRKIVALGITDCVIVETHDAILVVSKDRCQDIKSIIDSLSKEHL